MQYPSAVVLPVMRTARSEHMLRTVIRDRSFRLLLFGQTLSTLGDRALIIAFGIWVKELTGSNAAAGAAFFFVAFPYLFEPLAGVLIDRFPRRAIFITANMVMTFILLLALLVRTSDEIWLLYMIITAYGISGIIINPTQSALISSIMDKAELPYANGLLQTGRDGVKLLAPLIGAALFTVAGGHVIALLDAGTFVVAAACVWRARILGPGAGGTGKQRVALRRELLTGVRHVFASPALRQVVLALGTALLVTGFSQTLWFALVSDDLHRPTAFVGVLSSLQGAGAVAAGLTAGWVTQRMGDVQLVAAALACVAAAGMVLLVPGVVMAGVGAFLFGAGICWSSVGMVTAVQRRTPGDLQGRVLTAADGMVSGPQTVSIAVGAALSLVIDYRVLLALITVVAGGSAAWLRWRYAHDELEDQDRTESGSAVRD